MLRFKLVLLLNYETIIDPLLADIRKFTPEFCSMRSGDRILDVCCGTGAQVIEYGSLGIIATGVDTDPNMLKIASKNKTKHNLLDVSFYLADATELPFADNYFNYVSISLGLHDKVSVIRYKVVSEMIRVVRPDGALIFIDYPVPPAGRISGLLSRAAEFIAGGDHYKGFKDYIISGGLEHIVKVFNLHEEKRDYLKGGLIAIVKAGLPGRHLKSSIIL